MRHCTDPSAQDQISRPIGPPESAIKTTHADGDHVAPAHPRVGIRAARVAQAGERVRVLVEDDRRRAAAEDALSARVLVRRQAVDDVAAVVVDVPCACRSASAEGKREVGEKEANEESSGGRLRTAAGLPCVTCVPVALSDNFNLIT